MYKYDPGEVLIAPIPGTYAHKYFTDTLLATCTRACFYPLLFCFKVCGQLSVFKKLL